MKKLLILMFLSFFIVACGDDSNDTNNSTPTVSDAIKSVTVNGSNITYYVKSTGDDNNAGTNTSPFLTVQAAINKVAAENNANTTVVNNYTIVIDGEVTNGANISSTNPLALTLKGENAGKINMNNEYLSAVRASGSGAVITIEDLELTGSKSSGVYIENNATLVLTSGKIYGNTANYGAGVYLTTGATFVMSGGEITGNTNNDDGDGAGIYANTSSRVFLSGDSKVMGNNNNETPSNVHLKYYATNMGRIFINGALSATAEIGYDTSDQAVRSNQFDAIYSTSSYAISNTDFAKLSLDNIVGNYVAYQLAHGGDKITLTPHATMKAVAGTALSANITPNLAGVTFNPAEITVSWGEVNPGKQDPTITGSGANFSTQAIVNAVKAIDVSARPEGVANVVVTDDGSLSNTEIAASTTEVVTITYTAVSGYLFSNGKDTKDVKITLNIVK